MKAIKPGKARAKAFECANHSCYLSGLPCWEMDSLLKPRRFHLAGGFFSVLATLFGNQTLADVCDIASLARQTCYAEMA